MNKPDRQSEQSTGIRYDKTCLTTMGAKYNEISLFQHWRKMANCSSIKNFFQQEGATSLSKYPFSQFGLLQEVIYFTGALISP